jgi:hypothetical protein
LRRWLVRLRRWLVRLRRRRLVPLRRWLVRLRRWRLVPLRGRRHNCLRLLCATFRENGGHHQSHERIGEKCRYQRCAQCIATRVIVFRCKHLSHQQNWNANAHVTTRFGSQPFLFDIASTRASIIMLLSPVPSPSPMPPPGLPMPDTISSGNSASSVLLSGLVIDLISLPDSS